MNLKLRLSESSLVIMQRGETHFCDMDSMRHRTAVAHAVWLYRSFPNFREKESQLLSRVQDRSK
jgi:hypothetical protein